MAKRPTIEEFFTDPKYAEDAEFLKGAFNKMMNDAYEEAKKKKKEKKESTGFRLPFSFGSKEDDGENDE